MSQNDGVFWVVLLGMGAAFLIGYYVGRVHEKILSEENDGDD